MNRRFVTVEDVRRAEGREIVVDASTLVTPQALEAAQAAGVVIRGPGGPYVPPTPDRGPDAARAVHHLPLMPEPPSDREGGTGILVIAVGTNRPGILAEITATIAGTGGSVRDISQRQVDDYFHLVLSVDLPSEGHFQSARDTLQCLGGDGDYVVRVMNERVFRFMHRV